MTADEIMHALRQAAMGRIGTPEQQRLADALAALMAEPKQVMSSFSGEALRNHGTPIDGPIQGYEVRTPADGPVQVYEVPNNWYAERTEELKRAAESPTAKRTRKAKAE